MYSAPQAVSTSPAPIMRGVFPSSASRSDRYQLMSSMDDILFSSGISQTMVAPSLSNAPSGSSYYSASPYGSPQQSPRLYAPEIDGTVLQIPESRTFDCLWGNACHIPLDDITPGGLWRHLRDVHEMHDKHRRVFCVWDGGCGQEMNCASLGNHISTVHMKTAAQICPGCDAYFTRGDALARHMKRSCPSSRK